ncbi:MAG: universal stress protein [Chloroflexota bacterium]
MNQLTTLLVPLDGSDLSEKALPAAGRIAERLGSRVVLVRAAEAHVPPGSDPSEQEIVVVRDAEAYLANVLSLVGDTCTPVVTAVPYGRPVPSILMEIGIHQAGLVIMSTHGRGGLSQLVLGSVAASLLESSPVPILLLPGGAQFEMPRSEHLQIIVALDGSALARSVIPDALALLGERGGTITLVRVLVPPPARVIGTNQTGEDDPAETRAALAELSDVKKEIASGHIDVNLHVARGEPAIALSAVAQEIGAHVIALATHGRSGIGRLLLGSVAEQLIRSAKLPILIRGPIPGDEEPGGKVPSLPLF